MTLSTPESGANPNYCDSAAGLRRSRAFHVLYAYLVERNTALLGLRGFNFQLRIEQATTLEELQGTIGPLSEAIAKKHGLDAARNLRRQGERLIRRALAQAPN